MDFLEAKSLNFNIEGELSWPLLILAHGAGAPMDSGFMNEVTKLLLARKVAVGRFVFPYMAERRLTGKKRPPDGQQKLLHAWRSIIASCEGRDLLFIGGKSMGGRMATMVASEMVASEMAADEVAVSGVVCLGYPFHPPGRPEKTRTEHLQHLSINTLIVQGTRDTMGTKEDVEGYDLSNHIELFWLEDGNHDLKPRVKSGFTHEQHLSALADRVAQFCEAKTTT